jgi:hypothetical protein
VQFAIASLAMVAGVWLLGRSQDVSHEAPQQWAHRLGAEHGILVGFGPPNSFFVPPHTAADARLVETQPEPVEPSALPLALTGVERALMQYPRGFVASLVRAVFICGELRVGGARAGGTVGPAWIIVAAPKRSGDEAVFATSYIGLHHELSSFVLHKDGDTLSRWQRFTPSSWTYVEEPKVVMARGESAPPDPATGFLSAYGSTNPENDFNVYAEKMFTDPSSVLVAAGKQPIVRRKLAFVIATYAKVDSRMTATFRELGFE